MHRCLWGGGFPCLLAVPQRPSHPTANAADEEQLRQGLPAAVAAFARELAAAAGAGTAYVHCNGGRGRAPTIAVAYLYWLGGLGLEQAAATMTSGRKSSPKLPVVQAATADLLGGEAPAPAGALNDAERAAIKARLDALVG